MTIPTVTDDLLREIDAVSDTCRNVAGFHGIAATMDQAAERIRELEQYGQEMRLQCAAMAADMSQLEKDAARYRWLRDAGSPEIYLHNHPDIDNCKQVAGESLDSAIDTAMQGDL